MKLVFLVALTFALADAFQPVRPRSASFFRGRTKIHFQDDAVFLPGTPSLPDTRSDVAALKRLLVQTILDFRRLQERDGGLSIDYGVKGGEFNATSRAPQKVDFYSISNDVGNKAAEIAVLCESLSKYSPIEGVTNFLGDGKYGDKTPLEGAWKSLFATAGDANFSKNSKRGAARAQNVVDGKKGTITNVIDFETRKDGTEPLLKQIKVVIAAMAAGPKRVALKFKYAKADFLLGKFRWSLYIPLPNLFVSRWEAAVSKILRLIPFKKEEEDTPKKFPDAYFDVLYLDEDLRIHRTAQDNLFVQVREDWEAAKSLLVM